MKKTIIKHLENLGKPLEKSYGNKLIILEESDFENFAEELVKNLTIDSVSQQRELLLQAYKDGFDSATESVVTANKMVQERKLQ